MPFKTLRELDATEGTVLLFRGENHPESSDLVLSPKPSTDPNDPLRWPRWRKNMAYSCVCAFAATNNISGTVYSDVFVILGEHFGVTVDVASGLISYVILTTGLANFVWVPAALYFGKRPVFMLGCALSFSGAVWGASTDNFNSLLAACIFGAVGGGASEALGGAIINDIYFLHERGRKMAWSMIMLAGGSSLGPLVGGYLIENHGIKWGKWFCAILLGANLAMMIFFMPETRFHRPDPASTGCIRSTRGSERMDNDGSDMAKRDVAHLEKSSGCTNTREGRNDDPSQPFETDPSIPVKSQLAMLSPWSGTASGESFWSLMFRPVPLIVYPACLFATFMYSICLAPTVMINVLSGSLLIPPPYSFSIGSVGLINIPGLIGQCTGFFIGGYVIDKYAAFRARRNNGVFVPEERLALVFLPGTLVFVGILMFGFGAQQQMHWAVLFVGYGLVSLGLTGVASIAMTYVCDSYFPVAAECLELINGFKNVVAFGFIKATVPWVEHQGFAKAFGAIGGIFAFFVLLALPLVLFGPKIRHYTSTHWRLISWE